MFRKFLEFAELLLEIWRNMVTLAWFGWKFSDAYVPNLQY